MLKNESVDMEEFSKEFLDKYQILEMLAEYGRPVLYHSHKNPAESDHGLSRSAVALVVEDPAFSTLTDIAQKLNVKGFNNFRIFDNNNPGWSGYKQQHIICNGLTVEARIGYYDRTIKPEDAGEVDITLCKAADLETIVNPDQRQLSQPVSDEMSLSGFDYQQMSSQKNQEAVSFLEENQILPLIANFGQLHYYGSFKLGLMYRNDIDTALVVEKKEIETAFRLIEELYKKGFANFWLFDNSRGGWSDDPFHLLLDCYTNSTNSWELSFAICDKSELDRELESTKEFETLLARNPKFKKLIIEFKYRLAQKYGVRFFSGSDIYRAVIEDGVTTFKECEEAVKRRAARS